MLKNNGNGKGEYDELLDDLSSDDEPLNDGIVESFEEHHNQQDPLGLFDDARLDKAKYQAPKSGVTLYRGQDTPSITDYFEPAGELSDPPANNFNDVPPPDDVYLGHVLDPDPLTFEEAFLQVYGEDSRWKSLTPEAQAFYLPQFALFDDPNGLLDLISGTSQGGGKAVFPTYCDNFKVLRSEIDLGSAIDVVLARDNSQLQPTLHGKTDQELVEILGLPGYEKFIRTRLAFIERFIFTLPLVVAHVADILLQAAQYRAVCDTGVDEADLEIMRQTIRAKFQALTKRVEYQAGFELKAKPARKTKSSVREMVKVAAMRLADRTGEVPKRPDVANELGKSDGALSRQLLRYKLTYREIKREVKEWLENSDIKMRT